MSTIKQTCPGMVLVALVAVLVSGCAEDPTTLHEAEVAVVVDPGHDAELEADDAPDMEAEKLAGPMAYIVSPRDGARLTSPFKVVFGLTEMGVAPAGIQKDNTGHHHLLINVTELPPFDRPLPSTENIVHFGGGQTENWVSLPVGVHTLQLLLGDYAHIPHTTPVLSKRISVTVIE